MDTTNNGVNSGTTSGNALTGTILLAIKAAPKNDFVNMGMDNWSAERKKQLAANFKQQGF